MAEAEGRHPDLCLAWGRVDAITYTHKIKGLTESDFVLAAKIDREFFKRASAGSEHGGFGRSSHIMYL